MAAALGTPPITVDASTCGVPAADFDPMFSTATPLWLYVLAEARNNNGKLGVVGTHIVAETLITLSRRSTPSIFDSNGNRTLATKHKLSDIINLAALQDTEIAGA